MRQQPSRCGEHPVAVQQQGLDADAERPQRRRTCTGRRRGSPRARSRPPAPGRAGRCAGRASRSPPCTTRRGSRSRSATPRVRRRSGPTSRSVLEMRPSDQPAPLERGNRRPHVVEERQVARQFASSACRCDAPARGRPSPRPRAATSARTRHRTPPAPRACAGRWRGGRSLRSRSPRPRCRRCQRARAPTSMPKSRQAERLALVTRGHKVDDGVVEVEEYGFDHLAICSSAVRQTRRRRQANADARGICGPPVKATSSVPCGRRASC